MTPQRIHCLTALDESVRFLVAEAIRTHGIVHVKDEAARLEHIYLDADMTEDEIARLIAQAARAAQVQLDEFPPQEPAFT